MKKNSLNQLFLFQIYNWLIGKILIREHWIFYIYSENYSGSVKSFDVN